MAKIHEFMKKRRGLIWYVKNIDKLDEASIIEHVLNYGNFEDVKEMIKILGMRKVAEIFGEKANQKRCNYRPEIKHYFTLYFNKHASNNINRGTKKALAVVTPF